MKTDKDIDIGHDHFIRYVGWYPDRELNPQYADQPDVEHWGVLVTHKKPDGSYCSSFATFDGPQQRKERGVGGHFWQVHSIEPLTLSPSLLCKICSDHGFIREGRWVPA